MAARDAQNTADRRPTERRRPRPGNAEARAIERRLTAYLQHQLPEAEDLLVRDAVQIVGGASRETWSFDAEWTDRAQRQHQGFVMRREPDASLLDSTGQREYAVYRALEASGLPVPRAFWLEEDPVWLERPFFLMERIDGGFAQPQVLMSDAFAAARPELGRQKLNILAQIHALDWRDRGLECLGAPHPDACAERELVAWHTVVEREALEPQPVLVAAMQWLGAHLPRPAARVVLVHGDYRTGNLLCDRQRIRAVLDWEMAHLGDPMEDLGWLCLRSWRFQHDDRVGGLLAREQAFQSYEDASGFPVDPEAVFWWEVLANVKLAAIFLTGGRSFVEGRTNNLMMALVARMIPPLEQELAGLLGW
jgi:aminoglycoside phosphotransferase (APT) family kinase protein